MTTLLRENRVKNSSFWYGLIVVVAVLGAAAVIIFATPWIARVFAYAIALVFVVFWFDFPETPTLAQVFNAELDKLRDLLSYSSDVTLSDRELRAAMAWCESIGSSLTLLVLNSRVPNNTLRDNLLHKAKVRAERIHEDFRTLLAARAVSDTPAA